MTVNFAPEAPCKLGMHTKHVANAKTGSSYAMYFNVEEYEKM